MINEKAFASLYVNLVPNMKKRIYLIFPEGERIFNYFHLISNLDTIISITYSINKKSTKKVFDIK